MAGKPGHILEISDALGRDVDKAAAGKIAQPPIEAFLSDAALREIERATKARDEPVRADQLMPITRAEAGTRTTFDGETLPRAPSVRRVIPAPYRRPRIEAGSHGKTWQWVTADEVTEGDIVPEVGRVVSVAEHVIHKTRAEVLGLEPVPDGGLDSYDELVAVGTVTLLAGMGGQVRAFRPGTLVQVFRRAVLTGMTLRVGSLCSGYGGLDAAVCALTGGQVAWVADNDPAAALVLAAHYPGVPNLGDIAAVDWAAVPPVDVVTAGFPCQDVSHAGLRTGMKPGNRSGVWYHVARAITFLRPQLVVIENVKGLLSASAHSNVEPCPVCVGSAAGKALRALGAVLADLAEAGFDAEWDTVSAADAGGCHLRERVFIVAWPAAHPERDGLEGAEHPLPWEVPAGL